MMGPGALCPPSLPLAATLPPTVASLPPTERGGPALKGQKAGALGVCILGFPLVARGQVWLLPKAMVKANNRRVFMSTVSCGRNAGELA